MNIEELFRLAFEAGEEYADSLEWATYADNFPSWYEKHKADITELFSNALKGMYFATGRETICECEIPKPFDPYDNQLRHICSDCKGIIIEK